MRTGALTMEELFNSTPSTFYNHPTPPTARKKGPQAASKGRKWQGQDSNPGWPCSKPAPPTTSAAFNLPARAAWATWAVWAAWPLSESGKEALQAWELGGGDDHASELWHSQSPLGCRGRCANPTVGAEAGPQLTH